MMLFTIGLCSKIIAFSRLNANCVFYSCVINCVRVCLCIQYVKHMIAF